MQPESALFPKGSWRLHLSPDKKTEDSYWWDPLAMEQCGISTAAVGTWTYICRDTVENDTHRHTQTHAHVHTHTETQTCTYTDTRAQTHR